MIAPTDQHVGDRFGDSVPRRNGDEMRLIQVARDVDQVGFVKPLGFAQQRPCNGDALVARQAADQPGRRIAHRRKPLRQIGERHALDLDHQTAENVVEQRDLFLAQTPGALDEQGGHTLQRFGAALGRGARDRVDLWDQRCSRGHSGIPGTAQGAPPDKA